MYLSESLYCLYLCLIDLLYICRVNKVSNTLTMFAGPKDHRDKIRNLTQIIPFKANNLPNCDIFIQSISTIIIILFLKIILLQELIAIKL